MRSSEDDDLYGASVIRAARVMGQADGGEILVTDVVRHRCLLSWQVPAEKRTNTWLLAYEDEIATASVAHGFSLTQRPKGPNGLPSPVPVRVRIGINAGEPIEEGDDLHGASVVIAKRLESAAPTDGILVSDGVKQLLAGKDFAFTDQGEVDLKGFDEPVRAWAVAWEG